MTSQYEKKIQEIKSQPNFKLFLGDFGDKKIYLVPLAQNDIKNEELINNLAKWRREYSKWFPGQFRVTLKGTRIWLDRLVVNNPDRILFMIEDDNKNLYGHLGFYRYNPSNKSCELDNVVRGSTKFPGVMTAACRELTAWGFDNLGIKKLYLTVFADNEKAIRLYGICGFTEVKRIPLKKIVRESGIFWEENRRDDKVERYNLRMIYGKT